MAMNNPSETTTTKAAYNTWRQQNPTTRLNLDANKLANVRSDMIKKNRLTDPEHKILQQRVKQSAASTEELNNIRPTPEDIDNQAAWEMNVVVNCVDQIQMLDPNASSQKAQSQEKSDKNPYPTKMENR